VTSSSFWRKKNEDATVLAWDFELAGYGASTRTARKHAVEVTARTLYEAVARGLYILRQNDWIDGIQRNSIITIAVKEPEVEHKVRIRDFENWLGSNGKSPAEQALKSDLRALLNARMEEEPARRG